MAATGAHIVSVVIAILLRDVRTGVTPAIKLFTNQHSVRSRVAKEVVLIRASVRKAVVRSVDLVEEFEQDRAEEHFKRRLRASVDYVADEVLTHAIGRAVRVGEFVRLQDPNI